MLVTGHPYVDIWQAVKPAAVGIAAWPEVPPGPALEGGRVRGARRRPSRPRCGGACCGRVLLHDVETPLIGAIERLIDFVTEETG